MKFFKLILSTLIITITLHSCTKDEVQYDIENPNLKKSLQIQLKGDFKKVNNPCDSEGILSFKDKETYLSTMKQLAASTVSYTKAIEEQIGTVSTDEINRIYEEKGFNTKQPLFNFSEKLNFKSLFTDLYNKEEIWLENGGDNINEDPDNHFVSDVYERALFNINSEVIVGNKIYKKLSNGHLIISDLNFDLLCSLRNNADLLRLPKGVEFVGDLNNRSGKRMADCSASRADSGYEKSINNDGDEDFRIKWKVEINAPLFGTRNVKAITTNYWCKKNRNNGNCKSWKKQAAYATSKVTGFVDFGGGNCQVFQNFSNAEDTDFNQKVEARRDVPGAVTASNQVTGEFDGVNGITKTHVLTW